MREAGHYWIVIYAIKGRPVWEVAYWNGKEWEVVDTPMRCSDKNLHRIGSRIAEPHIEYFQP